MLLYCFPVRIWSIIIMIDHNADFLRIVRESDDFILLQICALQGLYNLLRRHIYCLLSRTSSAMTEAQLARNSISAPILPEI